MSVQRAVRVLALSERVPGKARCSLDFPIGMAGRTRVGVLAGNNSRARLRTPCTGGWKELVILLRLEVSEIVSR